MKYILIELFFGWMTTPIIHLNLLQIFTALSELTILCYIIKGIITLKRRKRHGYKQS